MAQTIEELAGIGRSDIKVVVGGILPEQDRNFLRGLGVIGIFGPGTQISDAAMDILKHFKINLE